MVTVYFGGQDSFGNRGCEALIRANVATLAEVLPATRFLVPSRDAQRDAQQWPASAALGVEFVPAESIPGRLRWWSRARRVLPPLGAWRPPLPVSGSTREMLGRSELFVMTGGDIISLDYGLESLYFWMSVCEQAMAAGARTVLLGASVGPFDADARVEARMRQFLRRFDLITVRETSSLDYLQRLGVAAELVADPAFCLEPEAPREPLAVPVLQGSGALLGFNVSPVIEKFRATPQARRELFDEVVSFLALVTQVRGDRVLLVPHVDPFSADGAYNSDSLYMGRVLQALRERGIGPERAGLLPATLNAAELKGLIAGCDFFMGGRTHATIAALSMRVPTTSIAYSVKAKGINKDLFGHLDFVLETPQVSGKTLGQHYDALRARAPEVRARLDASLPLWRQRARRSATLVATLMEEPEGGKR